MILVPRTSPSAKNRYLFFGGKLNKLPSSLLSAISEFKRSPVLRSIFPQALQEWSVPRSQSVCVDGGDESVHDFFSRRLGPAVADNMASALIHGIYAGDSRSLSVKGTMPSLVALEKEHGGLFRAILPSLFNSQYQKSQLSKKKSTAQQQREVEMRLDPSLVKKLPQTSIYSFPEGLGEIITALERQLLATPNVEIWKNTTCEQIQCDDPFQIHTSFANQPLKADRIVAAIPSAKLAPLFPSLPHLAHNPSATLGVVDVVLAPSDKSEAYPLPVKGFGYLVPRSATNNPHGILGVVFDSDAVPNQNNLHPDGTQAFVKLTVMIGGPYWQPLTTLPTEEDVQAQALEALESQLGLPSSVITNDVRFVRTRILRQTIPQYQVGHLQRMQELYKAMINEPTLKDRLSLLGYSYGGVGVNDCVANAMDTCEAIVHYEAGERSPACIEQCTGLSEITQAL